jgi:hypothetical protein
MDTTTGHRARAALRRRLLASVMVGVFAVALAGCLCRTGSACDLTSDAAPALRAQAVFNSRCTSCHGGSQPQGNLDLSATAVTAGLARHATGCPTRQLVVPGLPDESVLIEKVTQDRPSCGALMPPGGRLSPSEVATLRAWVESLAPPAADSGSDAAGDATAGDADMDASGGLDASTDGETDGG